MEYRKWNKSSEELPDCDGLYEVSNYCTEESNIDLGRVEYDGYGFKTHNNVYVHPKYWRKLIPLEKRYGLKETWR